jgi:ATP-dependent phosphofructokinase / diphosphate-dependent phosphofructokinase
VLSSHRSDVMHALVVQCGGPTAVVNRSLAALVRRWRAAVPDGALHGGRHGLRALITGDWHTLTDAGEDRLAAMEMSAGMALHGGRDRLTEADIDGALALLAARGVGTLFLIGGNGTMAAGRVLSARAAARVSLRVIGIPKTIDNDIRQTDVCPGFPSAARFLIEAVRDVGADVASMRGYEDVVLIETMGRHTGWLAAATVLARTAPDDAPHLVLVPEEPFEEAPFLSAVRDQHARAGICVASVAEGLRDPGGAVLAGRSADALVERDASGQIIFGRTGGPLPFLARLVRERLGLRCRLVRPDVLQRCSLAHVSPLDRSLAGLVATAAVDEAISGDGRQAVMIALRRVSDRWTTQAVPLDKVRGERTVPRGTLRDPTALRPLLS